VLTLSILVALGGLGLAIGSHWVMRRHLPPPLGPDEGTASISVVVAVRDEAPRVGAFVRSVLEQDHPDFELIVIDDRSTDGTRDVVHRTAGDDPRVEILQVGERPPGWQGRLYAQGVGARHARRDWLIFLSGDQRLLSRDFLRSMVRSYERSSADATSVVGPFTGDEWWHRWWFHPMINNPIFWGTIFLIQDLLPRSRWLIGALGLRRTLFESIGGVPSATACAAGGFDDWGWCRAFEERGLSTRMVYHPDLEDTTNWTSFATFRSAFARWLAGLFTYRRGGWVAAFGLVAVIGFVLAQSVSFGVGLIAHRSFDPAGAVMVATALGIGSSHCVWNRRSPWFALYFFVVGCLVIASVAAASWARIRNRVDWRGDVMRVVSPIPPSAQTIPDPPGSVAPSSTAPRPLRR